MKEFETALTKELVCHYCGNKWTQEDLAFDDQWQDMENQGTYECSVCDKVFDYEIEARFRFTTKKQKEQVK